MKKLLFAATVSMTISGVGVGRAESLVFDPNKSCREAFDDSMLVTQSYMGTWTLGFLSGAGGQTVEVNEKNLFKGLTLLRKRCEANPDASLVEVMSAVVGKTAPAAAIVPGSEADARRVLSEFLVPGADLAKLTYALKPSPADVRAVYREPLATNMIAIYKKLFTPSVKIGPKTGQTELLTFYSTTAKLAAGDAMRQKFPGGYDGVYGYMIPDFPIVRMKFVKPGETLGMASDGLIFVNNHWVFMPKPYRALDQ